MGIREEVAAIERQSAAIEQIGKELEAEGAEFWAKQDLLSACQYGEANQQATIMEADAETVGQVNG